MNVEKETLDPTPNFSKGIGYYLSGMEEVREQIRSAAKDLSNEEISQKLAPNAHSIGQLILHNAEAEWWWLKVVVAEKELDEDEAAREAFWDILDDEDFASKDYSAQFCIDAVDRVRLKCLVVLKDLTDDDLDRFYGWDKNDGTRIEKSLRWILHHLIDHEAQHKGQILMLKRLLRES
ncbi:MAG: DUF664 domain-containing protein [Pyrinomonadaceae bacterium]|nr:DUF664 domain-containing protein [Pyrinomonadaceae bacterium]